LVVAVSGSVVAVPLVGWAPFQPPEATQDCASCALHCNVAGDPMATLVLIATRETAGFAVVAATAPPVRLVWPVDDCSQAASAENAAQTIAKRSRYDAFEGDVRIMLLDWPSHPVLEFRNSRPGFRPINFIT